MKRIKAFITSKNKMYRVERFFVCRILRLYMKLLILLRPRYGLNINEKREKKIIISLTSYSLRFKTIVPTLRSLLYQRLKPDKIVVWLSEPRSALTNGMLELEKYGIEYRCDVEDLKSHKKYYWAFQEFSSDIVITVDDDCVYPPTLVSSLMESHKQNPHCVCARRVHRIVYMENGFSKYNDWEMEYTLDCVPSDFLMATGVGGGCCTFRNSSCEMCSIRKILYHSVFPQMIYG